MDPRLRARRIGVARERGRRRLHRLLAVLVVIGVLGAALATALSPVFRVRHVRVEGLPEPFRGEVEQRAAHLLGRPLLLVDLGHLRDELGRDPRFAAVKVTREPPGTIRVAAARRVPVAVAPANGAFALVSADGVVVDVLHVAVPGLPGLIAPDVPAEPGRAADRAVASLHALSALPPAVISRVRQLQVSDEGALVLVLEGGVPVAFGNPERDTARKGQVLETLMARVEGRGEAVSAYNVMSPESPAVVPG